MQIRNKYFTKNFLRNFSTKLSYDFTSSKVIRKKFLEYFIKENGHKFVRSSSVVPFSDPSVSFINAGMCQFKNIFLGTLNPPCKRAANSQKCIRVGGKHNDLSVVGNDGYHHTFFEMLGNWSFGDYFKNDACKMALNLLTDVYGINQNRMYVTYFGGDKNLNLPADIECREIWKSLGFPNERILPFGCKDNFWEMGNTGPCGPCTEIHIDHLPNTGNDRAKLVNAGYSDLTELWNIVFIEYNRNTDQSISPLPMKHIDTGMGFERLVALLQGKDNNYDTDLFLPLFNVIENVSKAPKYNHSFKTNEPSYTLDTAYRILADHTRMATVCLADGMFPDQNHKLRRILRKSILISERHFKQRNLINDIVPKVVEILGETYCEMQLKLPQIQQIIAHEIEIFLALRKNSSYEIKEILQRNPKIEELDIVESPGFILGFKELENYKKSPLKGTISGDLMFKLYDTYGLDDEIVEKLADIYELKLDREGFNECMKLARDRTTNLYTITDNHLKNKSLILNLLTTAKIKKTNDSFKYNYEFNIDTKCYSVPKIQTKILAIIQNGKLVNSSFESTVENKENDDAVYQIVTESSNFYYESGGQNSDDGHIIKINNDKEQKFKVRFVEDCDGFTLHTGNGNNFNVGDTVEMCVGVERRCGSIMHHTATHLLNASVRKIANCAICQKSSSVTQNGLKLELGIFGTKLESNDFEKIEQLVRNVINNAVPVKTSIINEQTLFEMSDVTLVPGEIYPETNLRLLEINDIELNSKELCCGTHARNTEELQDFCITNTKLGARGSYIFIGITGESATQAHSIGQQMLDDVLKISLDLENGKQKIEDVEARVQRLKNILVHGSQNRVSIPHSIKLKCLEILNSIHNQIKTVSKENLREFVEIEMKNALELNPREKSPFIIHFLESSSLMEFVPLQKATKCCPDRPILVISCTGGHVKARCCVPKDKINSEFNANKWLLCIAEVFKTQISTPKGHNSEEVCNMKPRKIKISIFEDQLETAIKLSHQYAAKYM